MISPEIEEVRTEVMTISSEAMSLVINNQTNIKHNTNLLSYIKKIKTLMTKHKEEITHPLMNALSSARELFKPFEQGYLEAEALIKSKMLQYEELVQVEKEKITDRLSSGEVDVSTATEELMNMENTGAKIKGKTSIRMVRKVRVVDASLIPREYLNPDMTRIADAVLHNNMYIPGIETYDEKTITSR